MVLKQRTKSEAVFLIAAVLLALYLMQAEAYRLSKTERQDGQKETTPLPETSLQPGVIVFGKGLENFSVEEDPAYQADFPGPWPKQSEFNQLFPSLQCGHDHMRFRAVGAPVKHFALNKFPSLPLSPVPTDCGYTMEGNPLRLVLHVPYDGCNVVIQAGHYNLALHWHGISVTLKCPKPDEGSTTVAPAPFFPWLPGMPQIPTTAAPHPVPHVHQGLWPYYFAHWHQMAQTTTPSPQDPVPHFHKGLWPYYYAHWHQLAQSTTPSPQDPVPHFHKGLWPYYYAHWHQLAQSTTPSPQDPVPHFHKGFWPYYFAHWHQLVQTTPSPQDPLPQMPANYWQYWCSMHKMFPCPSQPAPTTFPQDPVAKLPWQHQHQRPVVPTQSGHQHQWPVVPTQSGHQHQWPVVPTQSGHQHQWPVVPTQSGHQHQWPVVPTQSGHQWQVVPTQSGQVPWFGDKWLLETTTTTPFQLPW